MAQPNDDPTDVAVIGAGIIGISVTVYLAEAGLRVVLIDRSGICEETSSGNAGAFAFSDVLPLAQKGMMTHLPKWLLDPLGPLSIPPAYFVRLLPWLVRFWRAGRSDRYEESLAAQASLMALSEREWTDLLGRAGAGHMLREDGALELYESEREFRLSLDGWQARDRFGIAHRHIGRSELEEYQPGLAASFRWGTFVPDWKTVADPKDLALALWAYAQRLGARFVRAEVGRVVGQGDGTLVLQPKEGARLAAKRIVIAAGAWSHLFAGPFGDHVPLETERGYNTTLPADAFPLRRQLIFPGHGFVITPLATGIRVGGAVELAGLSRPPNYRRSEAMLKKAARFLPGLRTQGGRRWMGFRPSLPDTLPVIGRSRDHRGVFYAFGHGHLGLTQAAATGRLISEIILGHSPHIDITPFSAQRF